MKMTQDEVNSLIQEAAQAQGIDLSTLKGKAMKAFLLSIGEANSNAIPVLKEMGIEFPAAETVAEIMAQPANPFSPEERKGRTPEIEILGQDEATFILQGFVNKFANTGKFSSALLITAPAGTGKTHSYNTLLRILKKCNPGLESVEVGAASAFSVIKSQESQALLQALVRSADGIHTIIQIDEAHLLGKCGEAMGRIFETLLYGAGEGWSGRVGTVTVDGETYPYNTSFLTFALSTNFPEKIIKGNAAAVERRFTCVQLSLYSASVMRKMTKAYFEHKGLTVSPDAMKELVKIHRGTLVALDDFMNKGSGYLDREVTADLMQKILRRCKYTLRGFRKEEVALMQWLATTKEPRTDKGISRKFPKVDIGEFYRHASGQETKAKDGSFVATPFVFVRGHEYNLTDTAVAFLRKNAEQFATVEAE